MDNTIITENNTLSDQSVLVTKPLSLTQLTIRRFRKHKMAMMGIWILAAIIFYVTIPAFLVHGYCAPMKQEVYGEDWANCLQKAQVSARRFLHLLE